MVDVRERDRREINLYFFCDCTMKYTGPKFKLCRREGINLFGPSKYNVDKKTAKPWDHGAAMTRLSEYGKLLRNKQTLKRMYLLTERQFSRLVISISFRYSKNHGITHDKALAQFLERRLDSVLVKAGFATTIMQARQMIVHGHRLLNGNKHNKPSYYMQAGDVLELREKHKKSPLYSQTQSRHVPSWLNVDVSSHKITLLELPNADEIEYPVDVLKVIEFYARA